MLIVGFIIGILTSLPLGLVIVEPFIRKEIYKEVM